jgi:hypothetical protein
MQSLFARLFVLSALPISLAACNTPASAPQGSSPPPAAYSNLPAGVSPPGFKLPEGAGCTGSIARWKAIQDNDLATGHVGQSVYARIQKDIEQASAACQAGRDGEAQAMVRASRVRNGYPEG